MKNLPKDVHNPVAKPAARFMGILANVSNLTANIGNAGHRYWALYCTNLCALYFSIIRHIYYDMWNFLREGRLNSVLIHIRSSNPAGLRPYTENTGYCPCAIRGSQALWRKQIYHLWPLRSWELFLNTVTDKASLVCHKKNDYQSTNMFSSVHYLWSLNYCYYARAIILFLLIAKNEKWKRKIFFFCCHLCHAITQMSNYNPRCSSPDLGLVLHCTVPCGRLSAQIP